MYICDSFKEMIHPCVEGAVLENWLQHLYSPVATQIRIYIPSSPFLCVIEWAVVDLQAAILKAYPTHTMSM